MDSLEERLKSHARAFDGLLSIIPAKDYYGEDRSTQWQRKKQTKDEARAAKRAKLDPDNYKSAKDVLDERADEARTHRLLDPPLPNDVLPEAPLHVQHKPLESKTLPSPNEPTAVAEKRRAQRAARKEREAAKRAKKEKRKQKRSNPAEQTLRQPPGASDTVEDGNKVNLEDGDKVDLEDGDKDIEVDIVEDENKVNFEDEDKDIEVDVDLASSSSEHSPIFSGPSASSSISSLPAETISSLPAGSKKISDPSLPAGSKKSSPAETNSRFPDSTTAAKRPTHAPDMSDARQRLQARIDAMRNARRAPGSDGAQSRQELLDTRRRKEEARKTHKKELRRKAKEEEARQKAENLASGSPLMSPGSPRTPVSEAATNDFQFGRIEFGDGARVEADLSGIRTSKLKPKGPSDPATALIAAQKQQSRLAGMDEAKRAEIVEKDAWLNARKRAQGDRVRDNASLLKKTLQRKQKQKKKSEKEWDSRIEGVKKSIDARQKKRESNIQRRKDEKVAKGKKKAGKARPGFEGSFRAKSKPAGARRR